MGVEELQQWLVMCAERPGCCTHVFCKGFKGPCVACRSQSHRQLRPAAADDGGDMTRKVSVECCWGPRGGMVRVQQVFSHLKSKLSSLQLRFTCNAMVLVSLAMQWCWLYKHHSLWFVCTQVECKTARWCALLTFYLWQHTVQFALQGCELPLK